MAVYSGSKGIADLKAKIKLKSKMLVGESAEKISTILVDNSPLGVEKYNSRQGVVENDVGDFKNSWVVGLGTPDPSSRPADPSGSAAVADAISKGKRYNFEKYVYVTNNVDHAEMVENGWRENPEYGWKAKEGYHIVRDTESTAQAVLIAVAAKVSQL